MITEKTRREVWVELLEISRTCRYYEALQTQFTLKHQGLRVVTLVIISVGLAGVLDLIPGLPAAGNAVIAAIIAILMILESVANYSKKAAIAHAIYFRCSQLRVEVQGLWDTVEDEDAEDQKIRTSIRALALQSKEVENWVGFGDIHVDKKLNERTTKEAYDYAQERYNRQGLNANQGTHEATTSPSAATSSTASTGQTST